MATRRFSRSKTSPEMGWIVGSSKVSLGYPSGDPDGRPFFFTMFDFADIDPEALTGRIEKDKSDWFVKRVVLDWYGTPTFVDTASGDVLRRYNLAMCTIGNENADLISGETFGLFSPETYNLVSRMFRTWSCVGYAGGIINLGTGATGTGQIVVDSGDLVSQAGWCQTAPFYGPAHHHEDFEVSNAGLRNNQSCGLILDLARGPVTAHDWDEGDSLVLSYQYRILLQKRR